MADELNYYEYVQRLLRDEITSSNGPRLRALSRSRLAAIRQENLAGFFRLKEHIKKSGNDASFPEQLMNAPAPYAGVPGSPGEFRPFVHGALSTSADDFGGDRRSPWEIADSTARLSILKRHLLYSHRVVLPDPLFYVIEFFDERCDDAMRDKSLRALTNFLDFLYVVRELVRNGTLSFYPQYEHSEISQYYFTDDRFLDWVRPQATSPKEELQYQGLYHPALQLLFFCQRYQASCFIDQPVLEPVIEKLLQWGQGLGGNSLVTANDRIAREDRMALSRLVTLDLPGLEGLSFNDLIRVREASDGFALWRRHLKEGLNRIESPEVSEKVLTAAVRDSIAAGQSALDAEIRKSSLLATAKDKVATLAIGAVGGAVAGGPLGTAAGVAGAAIYVLYDFIKNMEKRAGQAALHRHYALWTKDPAAN